MLFFVPLSFVYSPSPFPFGDQRRQLSGGCETLFTFQLCFFEFVIVYGCVSVSVRSSESFFFLVI